MQGYKKLLGIVITFFCIKSIIYAQFNTQKNNQATTTLLPFLGVNNHETSPLEALNNILTTNKKSADEANKGLVKSINKINVDITSAQTRLKFAHDRDFEYLNKKVSLLNARKQLLMSHQELWGEFVELIEKHITLLKSAAEYYQNPKEKLNPVYSWKDFRSAQTKYAEHVDQVNLEKRRHETIKKQIVGEKESLASLQRQLDVKSKEREQLTPPSGKERSTVARISLLKHAADIFEQEINLLNEKMDISKLKIEKLKFEDKYKDDEIVVLQNKLADENDFLAQIERRLLLDYRDVELAKAEWKNEVQVALQAKEALIKEREAKVIEKEKLNIDFEFMREKIKHIKSDGEEDTPENMLTKSNMQRLDVQQQRIDRDILLLDAKKDVADVLAKLKELQYLMIEVRYRLYEEHANIDELLARFKSQKELELISYKNFKEKRLEAVYLLIENKRTAEDTKLKIDALKTKNTILFKDKEASLETIITNYNDVRRDLLYLTQMTQDFLGVCSDLINHQEMVLHSYELIINYLESRRMIRSIWERSSRAISLKAFLASLAEAESIGKKFFWDTPVHLAPMVLLQGIQKFSLEGALYILLFLFLFLFGFLSLRFLISWLSGRTLRLISISKSPMRTLYLNIAHAVILFAQEYFVFLFPLLFFYLHIVFRFQYVFCSLKNYAIPYNLALFYLITIPVLLYLANAFIARFKELNKKLSYLFFTEKFQDRFVTLLSLFFYSTAFFIPFRAAFLAYSIGTKIFFGDVLLAAYSLFVLVIILLFFGKEDVLTIVPSHNTFLIWFKRKIEKYYYPVFGFVMGLLILSNHSIGYSNLAWYLAFVVPLSIALFYLLFLVHHHIRRYSLFLFMQEDEDDIRDKFEYAKTYYGFWVIISFLFLLFATMVILARIWGLDIMPVDLWNLLSEKWVIQLGAGNKLGFVQFIILVCFIISGFLLSSLMHKFILNKLFDVLRTEPGLQNTTSRILHYMIISIALLLGLVTIHIDYYVILTVGGILTVGLGLALKDVLTDFVGGFLILLERPIEIGNYVQLDELVGTVHKIAARTTTLVTARNHSIIIPNRELLKKSLINWGHGRFAVGFEVDIRVRHDSDFELVRRTLISVVQANPIILRVPAIIVRLEAFEENALYFLIRAFISARRVKDQWDIAAQMRMEILKAFKVNDIKLAVPQRILNATSADNKDGALTFRFGVDEK
jgi:small-conductance mechanosensitive channel